MLHLFVVILAAGFTFLAAYLGARHFAVIGLWKGKVLGRRLPNEKL